MKVFIFGAGASYGSQKFDKTLAYPPLTDDIFQTPHLSEYTDILNMNEDEIKLIQSELTDSGLSLEEYFTRHWLSIEKLKSANTREGRKKYFAKITILLWIMLTHASEQYDWSKSSYRVLLNKFYNRDEDVTMVNFNYDTLLDRAIQHVYKPIFKTMTDYRNFGYIKPHGSVNWILTRRADDPDLPKSSYPNTPQSIEYIISQMFSKNLPIANLEILSPTASSLLLDGHNDDLFMTHHYCYPLMFMPLTTKLYKYAPSYLNDMLTTTAKFLTEADEVVLVGYQANDTFIKEALQKSEGSLKISVVSNTDRIDIANRLVKISTRFEVGDVISGGFANYAKDY